LQQEPAARQIRDEHPQDAAAAEFTQETREFTGWLTHGGGPSGCVVSWQLVAKRRRDGQVHDAQQF
jgi:hypothetical protein